ncbi:family 88 glycosyl hydrolase [Desarmillaria ectypa]|nr:family 88 glycosyl hydrolase [Desarmillaria ectypa]
MFQLALLALTILLIVSARDPFALSPGFDIVSVTALAKSLPSHSWEFGTASEALLELYNPEMSVYGLFPLPAQQYPPSSVKALSYAKDKIVLGEGANGLSDGDGAVGDPASLGVFAWLIGKTDEAYADGAREEIEYILEQAPRYINGAISQRVDVPELWADFIYMAPPFIAFYAADTWNVSLLYESYKQCGYYRETLQATNISDESYDGVWMHIIGPQSQDVGLWSTGNGWAAGGMTRVLATIMKAPVSLLASWRQEAIDDLTEWIKEIVDGVIGSPTTQGLARNYLDDVWGDGHGFGEISGTSLIASVIYRMVVLCPDVFDQSYISWADGVRATLGKNDNEGNPHVTSNGTVTPAVNPLGWSDTAPWTAGSPEGQCFVVLMYAAWRDCVYEGKCECDEDVGGWNHRK